MNFCFCRLVIMLNAMESISSGVMRGDVGEAAQKAVDAQIGMIADLEMQVGRPGFNGAAQEIVNIYGHREHSPVANLKPKLAWVLVPNKEAGERCF